MRATTVKVQIYTVVEVWRGMAQGARNFRRMRDAQRYMRRLRRRQNPVQDEAALFTGSFPLELNGRAEQQRDSGNTSRGRRLASIPANPLGKNLGDVWTIPNVKHNHVEKTTHPCQFPVELVERLVLALTNPNDLVLDPYIGVASAACAAVLHGRRAAGREGRCGSTFASPGKE